MQVAPEGVTIQAPARAGLFYGIQSLIQLLPACAGSVVEIPAALVCRAPVLQTSGSEACERVWFARAGASGLPSWHW